MNPKHCVYERIDDMEHAINVEVLSTQLRWNNIEERTREEELRMINDHIEELDNKMTSDEYKKFKKLKNMSLMK